MSDEAREIVRTLGADAHLLAFGARLRNWLLSQSGAGADRPAEFSESRARALLRAAGVFDEVTGADFGRLVADGNGLRVALFDLLRDTGLGQQDEVRALAAVTGRGHIDQAGDNQIEWLSLLLCSHAWKRGYPLAHLDPSSPPERFSPAGQVVANTAAFLRQQIQRNATERERIARFLAPRDSHTAMLEELQTGSVIPPLPPHFRPPVPVRYPEISRETLHVEPESEQEPRPVARGDALVIGEGDLPDEPAQSPAPGQQPPVRMPPIHISPDLVQPPQPPSPLPPSAVVVPSNSSEARPGLTVSLRQMFGSESLASTKLRVVARAYPDGPGFYGLQVKVSCKGIKSYVAGTTDREGRFVAELPVKTQEGLTYDVDLTWPREMGGDVERKSITLHADRTEFTLPFHRALEAPGSHHDAQSD